MSINRVMRYWAYRLLTRQYADLTSLFLFGLSLVNCVTLLTMTASIPLPVDSLSIPVAWFLQGAIWLLSGLLSSLLMSMGLALWLQSPRNRKKTPILPLIVGPTWHGFAAGFALFQLAVYTTPLGNMPLSAQDWRHIQLISLSLGAPIALREMTTLYLPWLRTMLRTCLMR
ncbi:hypothetical protein D3C85_1093200 [compost metagenome]